MNDKKQIYLLTIPYLITLNECVRLAAIWGSGEISIFRHTPHMSAGVDTTQRGRRSGGNMAIRCDIKLCHSLVSTEMGRFAYADEYCVLCE